MLHSYRRVKNLFAIYSNDWNCLCSNSAFKLRGQFTEGMSCYLLFVRFDMACINMSRQIRNQLATATFALCFASFGTYLWLFFSYFSSRPRQPHPELGLVHVLNNHGSYVYISAAESTGLAMLMIAFFVGFCLTFAIVPKEAILPPPGTPRWLTYVSAQYNTDLAEPTRRLKAIFCCALISYLGIFYLAGSSIADFVVRHGVILPAN